MLSVWLFLLIYVFTLDKMGLDLHGEGRIQWITRDLNKFLIVILIEHAIAHT